MCCMLAILFPAQVMLAGETASAMLYTNGAAWLNGSEVPKSAAVFSGDLLQTRPDSTASIQSNGSNVMVLADSLVKFEGPVVELEHGGVRVTTSRGLSARAGDVTIKPATDAWTEFQVIDTNGQVQIAANKGDVTVQDAQGQTTTVTQGQQTTKDDNHELGAGGLRGISWRGRRCHLDLDPITIPGQSGMSVEPLRLIDLLVIPLDVSRYCSFSRIGSVVGD